MRFGPAASLALGGGSVYYGTADATSLFVMLPGQLSRWGRHDAQVRALLPSADRALEWVNTSATPTATGSSNTPARPSTASPTRAGRTHRDGVNFADGRIAQPPIALAEVQGYAYAAYLARGLQAQEARRRRRRPALVRQGPPAKKDFNEAFWLPEHGWFAVGLDRDKRPIDALTSNIGHCLWTGIADRSEAAAGRWASAVR